MNIPQLASGSDDGAIKIWDLGSFLDEFGDGSATSEEQKEIVRLVVLCHLIVRSSQLKLKSGLKSVSGPVLRINNLHNINRNLYIDAPV